MLHLTTVNAETYTLLKNIFRLVPIRNSFALAGGTALALQIGHRTSIDLDIFAPQKFDIRELEILLEEDPNLDYKYLSQNSRMLFGSINNIKCDFVTEPATLINPFIEIDTVKYFSVADIAAMKLHTICGRGKKKDFFDIYALLEIYLWEQLLEWFVQKYDKSQLNFLYRSIQYFEDADIDPEIDSMPKFEKTWIDIKAVILQKCT